MQDWTTNLLLKITVDKDWNEEFQHICEDSKLSPPEKGQKIGNLANQFAMVAFLLGKIIIEEVHVSDKRIPPVSSHLGFAGKMEWFQHFFAADSKFGV